MAKKKYGGKEYSVWLPMWLAEIVDREARRLGISPSKLIRKIVEEKYKKEKIRFSDLLSSKESSHRSFHLL